jgi:hypothetical protein
MSDCRDLRRDEIVGHRIVAIRQESRYNDNGLDWVTSYFVLDSGVVFTLPLETSTSISTEEMPAGCELLEHPRMVHLYGQRITDVLRVRANATFCAESLFLLLENSYLVADIMGAHHGTGSAGVQLYEPGDIDLRGFEPVWPQPAGDI